MTKTCIHAIITGVVQGVFFRASTKEKADSLKITGWVQNLPTGQVECVLCGDDEQIKVMLNWLHEGPRRASVTQLEQNTIACKNFNTFDIQ